ncbi:hypothetical protein B1756_11295 [Natrarchaeobaculum aegyptiacum]|uniref:histidine kinase n=2 Tax=Natrarchaeobaculum aegyptiacum TaxID=745377 RepID=A0A2Z2HSU8_9EURY|nr:hypothetical protein B1756_11295 [Natrarchaeobaculum aegyptiacum]
MDLMGVRSSIERKFAVAMAIQYLAAIAVLVLAVTFVGPGRMASLLTPVQQLLIVFVIGVATVAFFNTIWVVRRDIIDPVTDIEQVARSLSQGELDRTPSRPFQPDETGDLKRSMVELQEHLETTIDQAEAVGREQFDDPILEERVPGAFGDALLQMQARLERRIREMRRFREAVEHAGHGVLITDVQATIVYVNPAFEDVTGYDREEVIGKTPRILNSGEQDAAFYEDLWSTILSGDVWEGEIINQRKDGSTYHVSQTISPLTEDGQITHFVSVNNDITELKERERDLERQNERLEEFGRTVAHDLRNPVQTIRGFLDVAEEADDPGDAFEEIRTSLDRMSVLIEELLELAREGQTVVHPEPDSLERTARAAWGQVKTGEMCLEVDEDAEVMMDRARVQQLLENLVRNAREHAGTDATVRIGTVAAESPDESDEQPDDPDSPTGFYVEDDGPGIPEKLRDSVFDTGYTTNEDGTGFGLAIVDQIADAHNWRVAVAEGSDGGARFEFRDVEFA